MSPMRLTAIVMILLLASQAGAAIVCPAECAPVAMKSMTHHGHEHHLAAAADADSVSAGQCSRLMVAESALAKANRVPEFALDVPVPSPLKSSQALILKPVSFGIAALEASSPPKFSVLRI
jgi:hypothetical protein